MTELVFKVVSEVRVETEHFLASGVEVKVGLRAGRVRQNEFVLFVHLALHEVGKGLGLRLEVAVRVKLLQGARVLRLHLLRRVDAFLRLKDLLEDLARVRVSQTGRLFGLFLVVVVLVRLVNLHQFLRESAVRHWFFLNDLHGPAPGGLLSLLLVHLLDSEARRKVTVGILEVHE